MTNSLLSKVTNSHWMVRLAADYSQRSLEPERMSSSSLLDNYNSGLAINGGGPDACECLQLLGFNCLALNVLMDSYRVRWLVREVWWWCVVMMRLVDQQWWARRRCVNLRNNCLPWRWSHVLFQQNVINCDIRNGVASNVKVLSQVQRQAMAENAQVVSIDGEFVVLDLSENYNFKWLIAFDKAWTVLLLQTPTTVLKMISRNYSFPWPDSDVEQNVLVGIQSGRVQKVDGASGSFAMSHRRKIDGISPKFTFR